MNVEKKPLLSVGNYLVVVMFGCIGLVQLIDRAYLDASICMAFALALASFGHEGRTWAQIPTWRRASGYAFGAAAAALFVLRVAADLAN